MRVQHLFGAKLSVRDSRSESGMSEPSVVNSDQEITRSWCSLGIWIGAEPFILRNQIF